MRHIISWMYTYFEEYLNRFYYWCVCSRKRCRGGDNILKYRMKIAGIKITSMNKAQKKAASSLYADFHFNSKWFDYYDSVYKAIHPHDKKYDATKIIPDTFFFTYVDPYFCHPIEALSWSDKNMLDLLLPDIKRPKSIIRFQDGIFLNEKYELISRDVAYSLIVQEEKVVIKPSYISGAGKGIVFWNMNQGSSVKELDAIFTPGTHYVVQEILKQHPKMASLYSGSINTLRMQTFLWKGEVHLLSCAVRMGANGSKVDNLSGGGGMSCGVNLTNGQLTSKAYDYYHINVTYDKHPQGCYFDGFIIPNWNKCVEKVKTLTPRFARFAKLIAWDIAIGEDGEPVLIECNLMYSGSTILQLDNGPLFGEMTDEVINEVKKNRRKKY